MKKFRFAAKSAAGKRITGVREAADRSELYESLREEGLFLTSCKEIQNGQETKRIKEQYLADFCREMGTLLEAGVVLARALAILIEEEDIRLKHRIIYSRLLALVRQGVPLSDAMERQGEAFPPLMVNMMRAAEMSGTMARTFFQMEKYFRREHKMKSKIKSALTYPAILGILIVAVVIIIFTYVLPQFQTLFSAMESLPWYTSFLLAVSDHLKKYWLQCCLGIAVAAEVIHLLFLIPRVRKCRDRWLLRLPIMGKLLKTVYTARFARTLSSLYAAGLPMIASLQISRKIIGNYYLESQFEAVIDQVRAGKSLSLALGTVDGFLKKFPSTVMIGEETGKLDEMLEQMAEALDYEAEQAIARMMALIEPIMIVIMALLVGFIMIAVITPIYSSYQSLSNGY